MFTPDQQARQLKYQQLVHHTTADVTSFGWWVKHWIYWQV
jgi:hypothetical protein